MGGGEEKNIVTEYSIRATLCATRAASSCLLPSLAVSLRPPPPSWVDYEHMTLIPMEAETHAVPVSFKADLLSVFYAIPMPWVFE